jgi:hypothetical protein
MKTSHSFNEKKPSGDPGRTAKGQFFSKEIQEARRTQTGFAALIGATD